MLADRRALGVATSEHVECCEAEKDDILLKIVHILQNLLVFSVLLFQRTFVLRVPLLQCLFKIVSLLRRFFVPCINLFQRIFVLCVPLLQCRSRSRRI
jgi:hypothetical protein